MKKTLLLIALFITAEAQEFTLSADIKPRYEYRHGFSTLASKNDNPAQFISQRTRFIAFYKSPQVNTKIAIQNVRVWGDAATMTRADKFIKFHEAWAEFPIKSNKIFLKLGRQEIVYDNHRIFGNVEWAQQARSHDAALIKILPSTKHRIDIGLTTNADNEDIFQTSYSGIAGYKNMQFLWYHGKFSNEKLKISFYAINLGREYQDTTNNSLWIDYLQTVGPLFNFQNNKIKIEGWAFYQLGKQNKANVNAYDASLNLYYTKKTITVGAGAEYLSGKANNDTTPEVKSFVPLFGTNHKFNGWMDYFYVGNHIGSVGLIDAYLILQYKKNKFLAKLIPHFFASAADIYKNNQKMNNQLGTEIDFTFSYKINEYITMQAGYSHLFPTEAMEVIKGGDYTEIQNWAWLMFVIRPTFVKTKINKK